MTTAPTNSAIVTDYKARTQASGALFERAREVLPSGITHDARYLDPYSIHVARAKGPRKWDVDGNEYVDYFGGHGAMLLGHSHPAVVEAVKRQMDLGTHYGSSHELEVRWAELVCELTPCAERVRFTASGVEISGFGAPFLTAMARRWRAMTVALDLSMLPVASASGNGANSRETSSALPSATVLRVLTPVP